jgi:uncharacterized DUF497 family protein
MYNRCIKFEWDPGESARNEAKHGIDFLSAQDLWDDENRIEIHAPHPLEDRGILIARYHEKIRAAVYTLRGGAIRMISVRRARKKEVNLYEKENASQNQ